MAVVVNDTFTEASDVFVTAHTGETGASWSNHPSNAATAVVDGGSDELHAGNSTSNGYCYCSGSPANADWKATITYRNRATTAAGNQVYAWLRMDTSALTGYALGYINSATPYFRLYKVVAGAFTQLGSDYTYTLPAADTDVDFYAVGSDIRAYKSDGTLMISATNSDVTSAGRLGFRFSDYAQVGASGGVNVSRLQGWDSATIPVPAGSSYRPAGARAIRGLYVR